MKRALIVIAAACMLLMPVKSVDARENPILGSAKLVPVSKEASKKIVAKGAVADYYGNYAQYYAYYSYHYAYYGYVYSNASYYSYAQSYAIQALTYSSYAYILTAYGY